MTIESEGVEVVVRTKNGEHRYRPAIYPHKCNFTSIAEAERLKDDSLRFCLANLGSVKNFARLDTLLVLAKEVKVDLIFFSEIASTDCSLFKSDEYASHTKNLSDHVKRVTGMGTNIAKQKVVGMAFKHGLAVEVCNDHWLAEEIRSRCELYSVDTKGKTYIFLLIYGPAGEEKSRSISKGQFYYYLYHSFRQLAGRVDLSLITIVGDTNLICNNADSMRGINHHLRSTSAINYFRQIQEFLKGDDANDLETDVSIRLYGHGTYFTNGVLSDAGYAHFLEQLAGSPLIDTYKQLTKEQIDTCSTSRLDQCHSTQFNCDRVILFPKEVSTHLWVVFDVDGNNAENHSIPYMISRKVEYDEPVSRAVELDRVCKKPILDYVLASKLGPLVKLSCILEQEAIRLQGVEQALKQLAATSGVRLPLRNDLPPRVYDLLMEGVETKQENLLEMASKQYLSLFLPCHKHLRHPLLPRIEKLEYSFMQATLSVANLARYVVSEEHAPTLLSLETIVEQLGICDGMYFSSWYRQHHVRGTITDPCYRG